MNPIQPTLQSGGGLQGRDTIVPARGAPAGVWSRFWGAPVLRPPVRRPRRPPVRRPRPVQPIQPARWQLGIMGSHGAAPTCSRWPMPSSGFRFRGHRARSAKLAPRSSRIAFRPSLPFRVYSRRSAVGGGGRQVGRLPLALRLASAGLDNRPGSLYGPSRPRTRPVRSGP